MLTMVHEVIDLTLDDDVALKPPPSPVSRPSLLPIAASLVRTPRPAFESPRAGRKAGAAIAPAHAVRNTAVQNVDGQSDRNEVAKKQLVRREPYGTPRKAVQPAVPSPGPAYPEVISYQNRQNPPCHSTYSVTKHSSSTPATGQTPFPTHFSGQQDPWRPTSNRFIQNKPRQTQSQLRKDTVTVDSRASSSSLDTIPPALQRGRPEQPPQHLKRSAEDHVSPQALLQPKRARLSERTRNYLHPEAESEIPQIMQSIEPASNGVTSNPAQNVQPQPSIALSPKPESATTSRAGLPYSQEEDDLLLKLREAGVPWGNMKSYFKGRSQGSLQVRFSSKLARLAATQDLKVPIPANLIQSEYDETEPEEAPRRRLRKSLRVKSPVDERDLELDVHHDVDRDLTTGSVATPEVADHTMPSSQTPIRQGIVSRVLRHRELGTLSSTSRSSTHNLTQLKEYSLSTLGGSKFLDDTSGDVSAVAWSSDGQTFAAGGVVLSDPSSMQYNKPRNLLLGKPQSRIRELADHYIPRSTPDSGVNSLPSMQSSQDPRLFTTVQMVGFSKDNRSMFSASIDGNVNAYKLGLDVEDAELSYQIHHAAPVDLLSVSNHGCIATGSRSTGKGCIKIFKTNEDIAEEMASIGPEKHSDTMSPSALKWGVAPNQSNFLLAGFTQESQREYEEDEESDVYGDICILDGNTGQHLPIAQNHRSVFDVAWNPHRGHTAFAVASVASGKLNKGMHSVVRLFTEADASLQCGIELECPARDINDVVYCPFDENLIAAGSTDGKVYVWDTRYAKTIQTPHRRLAHGGCISILEHDRPRWEVDTGIRFLQWGSTHTSLFSGSSDSVVKRWNPYLAPEDSHVYDVFTGKAAIMSGAFSPEYSRLLIGEDGGRLNMLEVGHADKTIADMERFQLISAQEPSIPEEVPPHRELLETGKIVFERCGALPINQAVQNPNLGYNITFGKHGARNEGYNQDELIHLHANAEAFQKNLHKARKTWKKLKQAMPYKVVPCELDCGFLPRGQEEEAPDTQKSLSRIADELRCEPPKGIKAIRRGLVAKCHSCSAPAPAAERDDATEMYCAKCKFECFRCGQPASLGTGENVVHCASCEVTWDVGVLGYDIIEQTAQKMKDICLDDDRNRDKFEETESEGEEIGEELMAHYMDKCTRQT